VVVLASAGALLGGLGLIGAGGVQLVCWSVAGPGSPGAVVPMTPATAEHVRTSLPAFRAFETLVPATAPLLAALVLGSGLALLSGRPWARTAAVVVAGAVLLTQLVAALYESIVVLPGIERWRDVGVRPNVPQRPPAVYAPPELRWVPLVLLIGGLVYFVHAVATLVVLHAPVVADFFRRGDRAEPAAEE
jgi:hypothetical protein